MRSVALGIGFLMVLVGACKSPSSARDSSETSGLISAGRVRIFAKSADELVQIAKSFGKVSRQVAVGAVLPREGLEVTLVSQIVAFKGIPRSQIKSLLSDLVSLKSTACGGVSCARLFNLEEKDIDSFLDDILKSVESNKSLEAPGKAETKGLLVASLARTNEIVHSPRTRMYDFNGKKITEVVYVTQKPIYSGQFRISLQRELSWVEGGAIKKESYSGVVDYGIDGDTFEIHVLDSNPEGVGSGSIVLKELVDEAKRKGIHRMETLSTAVSAQDFYFKIGFRPSKDLVRQLIKDDPKGYQNLMKDAQKNPKFSSMTLAQRDDAITKSIGRVIATWEASTETVAKNTDAIQYGSP